MDDILDILMKDARLTAGDIAKMTGKSVASVKKAIQRYEKEGAIVGYKTLINQDLIQSDQKRVRALIEVSVSPKKNSGFDHIAERIYQFPEVSSCYLLSGSYDLLVIVEGEDIQTVSDFVASKLSPLESVNKTATHFLLRKYKEDGHVFARSKKAKRLNISY